MKVLITGANGFIGSSLVRYFLDQQYDVRGMVRANSNCKLLDNLHCELVYGDITEPAQLEIITRGIDVVVHTAGISSDWGEWNDFLKINFEGTKNMALAASRSGVKRFIHISSVAIHWFPSVDIKEDGPTPVSHMAYSESKKLAEEWLNNFAATSAMEVVIIRPGNVYGPYDEKFIAPYLDFIKLGKFSYINGGEQLTCPTYIENLVYGILLACTRKEAAGQTFILTDGMFINWRTFTEALLRRLDFPLPKRSVPFSLAYFTAGCLEMIYKLLKRRKPPLLTRYRINNAGKNYHFSISKAQSLLTYQPIIDFDTAIKRTIDWYAKNHPSV